MARKKNEEKEEIGEAKAKIGKKKNEDRRIEWFG